ncbi:MAG: hypothetical protein Q9215_007608 [Flavoplaca cf. flavocitrina]
MTPSASQSETMVVPTSESLPSTWYLKSQHVNFHPPTPTLHADVPTQRPRAWERLPKSPFSRRRKGRKVWKRYEVSTKAPMSDMGACLSLGTEDKTQDTDAENVTHNAKRLRSRDVSMGGDNELEQRPSKYITTLQDQVVGTPRRKVVKRKSLRPDRLRRGTAPADSHDDGLIEMPEQGPSTPDLQVDKDTRTETTHLEALEEEQDAEIEADPVQPIEGPRFEDIDEALSSPLSSEHVEEDRSSPLQSPDISFPEIPNATELISEPSGEPPIAHNQDEEVAEVSLAEDTISQAQLSLDQDNAAVTNLSESVQGGNHETALEKRQSECDAGSRQGDDELLGESEPSMEKQPEQRKDKPNKWPRGSTNPRQSLRRSSRRSSIKKDRVFLVGPAADTDGPSTIVETSENAAEQLVSNPVLVPDEEGSESPSHDRSVQRASQRLSVEKEDNIESQHAGEVLDETDMSLKLDQSTNIINIPASDLLTPNEALPTIYKDECALVGGIDDHTKDQATVERLSESVIDEENRTVHDVDSQVRMLDPEFQNTQSPQRKTRSGARFSDDTNMLKDFLSRAQARKLSKEVTLAPGSNARAETAAAATSPRRSQRNALATLDSNSPSPRKPPEVASHPGTPPNKPKAVEVHGEDDNEAITRGSPVRRSSRKRLPAPAKTATGAPSFIPVRRADGTDPVVLQKSVAQELALITQSNTRRNKGQAKPPAVILKSLPVELVEDGSKGGHALRNCKTVGWDQKLVYYQNGTEALVEVESKMEEKGPKARRLRGLGTGNGTPAPKRKTADMVSSNGTAGSKRAGRVR